MRNLLIALVVIVMTGCAGMTANKTAALSGETIRGLNQQVMIAYDSGWIDREQARDMIVELKKAVDQTRTIEATLDICDAGEGSTTFCDVTDERQAVDDILADIQRKLQEAEQ